MHNPFKDYGFEGGRDFFAAILGFKDYPFTKLQFWGTFAAGAVSLWQQFIWDPPGAAFLVIFLTLINFYYGYQVARKIKKQPFSWEKAHKTFAVIISDVVIMAVLHWIIKYYPYYSLIADALFGYFFTWKLRQIWVHMSLLKLQDGTISGYFRDYLLKVLQQKLGAQMVDNLQKMPAPKKEEETPEEI